MSPSSFCSFVYHVALYSKPSSSHFRTDSIAPVTLLKEKKDDVAIGEERALTTKKIGGAGKRIDLMI
ncbi:unnamed protein product [Cuscuta campestris]|uniref:Uncharacterized protein n=1 Tax=Cuscuta campestris TaxID=132261 RepID=A0A484KY77_9ASTE|nr:unnamed protein product [Cuscuta campestris]